MKVYAEALSNGDDGIKKGDRFEVVSEKLNLIDKEGFVFEKGYALWESCSWLNGGDWKRIEINEGNANMIPIKLENGCYTKIDRLSVEDQKRVLKYYQSFNYNYSEVFSDDDRLLANSKQFPYLVISYDRILLLGGHELDKYLGFSAKHIPAEDILNSLQHPYKGNSVSQNLSLLAQIKQAKIAYDEAEKHLQSLLNKGHEKLGDCGISFEIR